MGRVRVIIVQKSEALANQLVDFLTILGMTVEGTLYDLLKLEAKAQASKADIILVDIRYLDKRFDGFCKSLKETLPQVKVVLMGPEPEAYYARYAIALGADRYISEALPTSEWVARLRSIAPDE